MFFYKHNIYKHTEPDFWQKFKNMLSIICNASLNFHFELNFFFEFNPSTRIIRNKRWLMKLKQYSLI